MKRLIDFFRKPQAPSAPTLRNRPQGMAWIYGLNGVDSFLNGRAVKTVRFVNGYWEIEPAQPIYLTDYTTDVTGQLCHPGDGVIDGILDKNLEPWKDTGLTDEEVRDLYSKQPHPAHDQLAPSRPKVLG